jgi:hypothetical protein
MKIKKAYLLLAVPFQMEIVPSWCAPIRGADQHQKYEETPRHKRGKKEQLICYIEANLVTLPQ